MPKPVTNPTLYDVAREAGVSLATASRSLNGSARKVNDAYRDRVLAAAEKLGYVANLSAQAVAKGGSNAVTLLVSDIADPYFSSIASGVMAAADDAGYSVTIGVTNRSSARELELVRLIRGQRPRVVILAGSRAVGDPLADELNAELEAFAATGGRVVMISTDELAFDTVRIDNAAGARSLAAELVGLGYRRFAVLAGPADLVTAKTRSDAFLVALGELGIPVDESLVIHGGFTREAARTSTLDLLDSRGIADFELLLAINDVMAIGALAALRDRGVDVPGTVALAGFDDIPNARDVTPALTTVHVPLEEAGRGALSLALAALEGTSPSAGSPVIPATVVIRDSTPRR